MDDRRVEVCGQRKLSNDPRSNQHNPGTPTTVLRERGNKEHRPQQPTKRSDPPQHAKGRTCDCPGPRKETATRRNVTQGVAPPPPPSNPPLPPRTQIL